MYAKNEKGFTLLELVIVTALLGILIPLTSSMIINTYNEYVKVSMINRMAASGDNALRSVTKDITIMKQIQKADEKNLYFTLLGAGKRYYRFHEPTNSFQLCMTDCVDGGDDAKDESFGILSKNLNINESGFQYYKKEKKISQLTEISDNLSLSQLGWWLTFQSALPAIPSHPDLLIGYIKVKLMFGLIGEDDVEGNPTWQFEIPLYSIVRPALPS